MPDLSRPQYRLLPWTLGLTYIAAGILSALPGASLIQLAQNTHVSLEVAGWMFTASALGFLLGAVFTGALAQTVQPKYLLAVGLFLLGVGSFLIPLTGSFPTLLVSQIVKGAGFGFIDVSLNTLATLAFKKDLGARLNVIHGMYGVGALIGPGVLALALQFFNNLPLSYLVGIVIALLTLALLLAQSTPELPRAPQHTTREQATNASVYALIRQGVFWMMVLQISLYVGAEIGFGNWIVTAVSESAGLSLALAAPVATAYYAGLAAGRLLGAQVLKRGWLSEAGLLYVAVLGSAVSGVVAALFPGRLVPVYIASALVGCFYGPLFPGIMAIMSRRFVDAIGPASTLMMVGTGAGSMLFPALMGVLIPPIGINWVIALPTFLALAILAPMLSANRVPMPPLQLSAEPHTMAVTTKHELLESTIEAGIDV